MSDLKQYIQARKEKDPAFAQDYETGYNTFKLGVVLKTARESAGLTQAEVARRLHTQKSAISQIENHAENTRLSTLERFAKVVGHQLEVSIR